MNHNHTSSCIVVAVIPTPVTTALTTTTPQRLRTTLAGNPEVTLTCVVHDVRTRVPERRRNCPNTLAIPTRLPHSLTPEPSLMLFTYDHCHSPPGTAAHCHQRPHTHCCSLHYIWLALVYEPSFTIH